MRHVHRNQLPLVRQQDVFNLLMSLFAPHRRRWLILALIFAAFALNYFDRQIVSILKPTLKSEFQIDDRGYAFLINVFQGCYAAMYPVAGLRPVASQARAMRG